MKHRIVLLLALFFAVTTFKLAVADVPSTMNYQGRLTKQDAAPLADGNHDIHFYLYNAATGGSYLWSETHTVTTKAGYFNVVLGSKVPLSTDIINTYRYLAISVDSDSEMTPRQPLASVPYAMMAANALTVNDSSVTNTKIVDGAVSTAKIADNAVTSAKIAPNSVTLDRLSGGDGVPPGTIIMVDGTHGAPGNGGCPAGYTRLSQFDNMFPRGAVNYGATGGSDTHDHGGGATQNAGAHTHAVNITTQVSGEYINTLRGSGVQYSLSANNHTHLVSGNTESAGLHSHNITADSNVPRFFQVIFCKKK